MTVYVDHTHLGRHVTGLERITTEQFSPHSLAPVELTPVTARGTPRMMATQTLACRFGSPILPPFCCARAFRRARCCCRSRSASCPTSTTFS